MPIVNPLLNSPLLDSLSSVVLLVLVNISFSSYQVLSSLAFQSGASPLVFAFLRDFTALLFFLPTCWLIESRHPPAERQFWIKREHGFHIVALGLLVYGTSCYSVLAIKNLSAQVYGLLSPTAPIVTILASWAFGVDVFNPGSLSTWAKIVGIILSVGGAVVLVVFSSSSSAAHGSSGGGSLYLGLAYIVGHKLSCGLYPLLQKVCLVSFTYPSLTLTTWAYTIGVLFVGLSVTTGAASSEAWQFSPITIGAIAFSGVVASFFNYYAMAFVNNKTAAWFVMAFYPLQSIFTPYLSALFLGSTLGAPEYIGGAVVVLGLGCCIGGQLLDGSGLQTGAQPVDPERVEALTLTLTAKDVEALVTAGGGGGEEGGEGGGGGGERGGLSTLKDGTLPILHRALSRRTMSVRGEGGGGIGGSSPGRGGSAGEGTPFLISQASATDSGHAILARATSIAKRKSFRVVGGLGH